VEQPASTGKTMLPTSTRSNIARRVTRLIMSCSVIHFQPMACIAPLLVSIEAAMRPSGSLNQQSNRLQRWYANIAQPVARKAISER
jgi:hypothetical protein